MKTWMRRVGVALAFLFTVLFASSLYYYMPRATKVTISGTDVKRMDREGAEPGQPQTRDVRFVYATEVDSGKALAFRNEDNGWYLKWDSGDIAAEAMSLARPETADTAELVRSDKDVVLVKYYGIRIPVLDLYPNILSLKKVPEDYVYIPYGNIVFLIVLLALFIWGGVKLRRFLRAAGEKAKEITKRKSA